MKASAVSIGRLLILGNPDFSTTVCNRLPLLSGACRHREYLENRFRLNSVKLTSSPILLLQFLLHVNDVKGAAQFEADVFQASGMYKKVRSGNTGTDLRKGIFPAPVTRRPAPAPGGCIPLWGSLFWLSAPAFLPLRWFLRLHRGRGPCR